MFDKLIELCHASGDELSTGVNAEIKLLVKSDAKIDLTELDTAFEKYQIDCERGMYDTDPELPYKHYTCLNVSSSREFMCTTCEKWDIKREKVIVLCKKKFDEQKIKEAFVLGLRQLEDSGRTPFLDPMLVDEMLEELNS